MIDLFLNFSALDQFELIFNLISAVAVVFCAYKSWSALK